MTLDIRIYNQNGTRSTSITDQRALDVVTKAINEGVSKASFNRTVFQRLHELRLLPDFNGPDSREEVPTPTQAHFNVLNAFEYSFEGSIKRYPDEAQYKNAIEFFRRKLNLA